MNTPQTPTGGSPADEPDTTGIRELLASLPDPGPMPGDVSARIEAALRAEHDQRGTERENVTPLVARSEAPGSGEPRTGSAPSGEAKVLGAGRWLKPLAGLGAAAAIGIGALAGYQALNNSSAPNTSAVPTTSSSAPSQSGGSDLISITNSGTDYSANTLATQASHITETASGTTEGERGGAADSAAGDVTTKAGLMSCLTGMGGDIFDGGLPDKISADLGNYEGKPAVVVVITKDGKSQAWVFSRTCSNGQGKIAGPTAVT
ncbi:hypothetical protein ACMYYO_00295 [Dermacoccaceae bacterium W4C1]